MKQRLRPLVVPWMVSPSVPKLRLSTVEGGQPAVVQFIAHFALRAGWTDNQQIGFSQAEVMGNPSEPPLNDPAYGLVRLMFEEVAWAHMFPSFSDREVLNPDEFDASAIPYSTPSANVGAWLRDFQSLWMKTGNCPDPRAYLVESSLRLASLNLQGYEHIVIEGHDEYVEVIARSWHWLEIVPTPDSERQAPRG